MVQTYLPVFLVKCRCIGTMQNGVHVCIDYRLTTRLIHVKSKLSDSGIGFSFAALASRLAGSRGFSAIFASVCVVQLLTKHETRLFSNYQS